MFLISRPLARIDHHFPRESHAVQFLLREVLDATNVFFSDLSAFSTVVGVETDYGRGYGEEDEPVS